MGAKQSREVTKALEYVRSGHSPQEAASKYGVTADAVRRAMRRSGLPIRKPGRPKK